jgi:3-oxoacyl-[acyl-carrier-protein] synthase II
LKRRVVVTGMGAVTPLGVGVEASWRSLCQGKSGVGAITGFDASSFRTRVAGEVKGFNPLDFIDRKLVRRGDRFIHFALAATRMALDDSGLTINAGNSC